MNKTVTEALEFEREIKVKQIDYNNAEIVIAPTYTALTEVYKIAKDAQYIVT